MKTLAKVTGALALAAAIIYTVVRMRRAPKYPARAIPEPRQLPGLENLPPQELFDAEPEVQEPLHADDLRVAQNSPL